MPGDLTCTCGWTGPRADLERKMSGQLCPACRRVLASGGGRVLTRGPEEATMTDPITDPEEARRLREAATPGPWEYGTETRYPCPLHGIDCDGWTCEHGEGPDYGADPVEATARASDEEYYATFAGVGPALVFVSREGTPVDEVPDCRLIAAAPALARGVEALAARVAELEAELATLLREREWACENPCGSCCGCETARSALGSLEATDG